ncbi:uncharacterized protein LOC144437985 [Glandiceps talaboti]
MEKKNKKRKHLPGEEEFKTKKRKRSIMNVPSVIKNDGNSGGNKLTKKHISHGKNMNRKQRETLTTEKCTPHKKCKITEPSGNSNHGNGDVPQSVISKSKLKKFKKKKKKSKHISDSKSNVEKHSNSVMNLKGKKKRLNKKKLEKVNDTISIHEGNSKVKKEDSKKVSSEKKLKVSGWRKRTNQKKKQYKAHKRQANKNNTKKIISTKTPASNEMSSNWKNLAKQLNINTAKKTKTSTQKQEEVKKGEEKQPTEQSSEIWFDDVDPFLVQASAQTSTTSLKPESTFAGLTKCVALDCEMVGAGVHGKDNELARVSIVNQYGMSVYDKYVKPREKVTDYRTAVSGIRPEHIKHAEDFKTVQQEVADIIKGRILVGHALYNDMKVLFLSHPRRLLRDTAKYKPFKQLLKTKRPGLKKLVKAVLNVTVQEGEHNSIEDAHAAMKLYILRRKEWDAVVKQRAVGIKRKKVKKVKKNE